VTIVCGGVVRANDDVDAVTNPTVLVEVLSDSSEAYDRGEKFAHYRRIASLREYVLVSQRRSRVEVYERGDGRHWTLSEYVAGERAAIASVGVEVDVDEIYRGVEAAPSG
jgi:Uma2 family endonuclease